MEVDDSIFGTDYSSNGGVTSTGDIELVTGIDNARQSIYNQLLTEKGAYPSMDTDYGSEIYEVLGEDFYDAPIEALKVHIEAALFENPRVLEIDRIDEMVTVDKKLNMIVGVVLVNGTEDTLNISFGGLE